MTTSVVLAPEDMLLVMELAGYHYQPGTENFFPSMTRHPLPAAPARPHYKGDIIAEIEAIGFAVEMPALFAKFIARQEGKQ